jgi:hypothetical protein
MANYVGGDKFVVDKKLVTAAANLVDKTLVCANGTVPSNAANTAYGVLERDTADGDLATLKYGIVEVIATGTVTEGAYQEVLTSTFTTKDDTGVTGAGVQDVTSTDYIVGRALTGGSVNDTVLINMLDKASKNG